jgi:hypothetical protein
VPRPAFSPKDRLFGDWLKRGDRTTKYAKHIEKLHIIFPDRCLKDLRDLKKPDYDLSSKTWESLGDQTYERTKALQVANMMRADSKLTLEKAIKEINKNEKKIGERGISEKTVRIHLGNTLYKNKNSGRWSVRKTDSIETKNLIYSEGKSEYIRIRSSKDRALLRQYKRDTDSLGSKKTVKEKEKILNKYKMKTVTDVNGKKWKLESTLEGIERSKEPNRVFQSYYAR